MAAAVRRRAVAADPAHERLRILLRAADLADERASAIAALISAENGKSIREATVEASRCGDVIRTSAFEGAHLYGESRCRSTPPPAPGSTRSASPCASPAAWCWRSPPFNYPGLLAIHKVAPALAAGNAVVLKPAELTPLTALALADCFLEAGLPGPVLSVVTGHGSEIGDALVADPRCARCRSPARRRWGSGSPAAGVKKLSLELGSSSPVVILPDADLEVAASAVAAGGYANAGQVCISVQRVITHPAVTGDFLDALVPRVAAIRTGDPRPRTRRWAR